MKVDIWIKGDEYIVAPHNIKPVAANSFNYLKTIEINSKDDIDVITKQLEEAIFIVH